MIHHTRQPYAHTMLNRLCLNGGNLLCLPGRSRNVQVLRSGNFSSGGREEDLDVTRVTLVRVAIRQSRLVISNRHKRTFDRELGKSSSWSLGPG